VSKRLVKFVYCCDPHYSSTSPEGRTEDYGERVLKKLRQVGDIADVRGADAVLIGGDVFHRKDRVTHHEVSNVARELLSWGEVGPVLGIWGNHDAAGPAGVECRPYGVLVAAGLIHDVSEDAVDLNGVVVTGLGHRDEYERPESYVPHIAPETRPIVMLTHGMLMFEKRHVPFECTQLSSISGQFARVVLAAHLHDQQGVVFHDGCTYVSPGGLGRVSRPEESRVPSVAVVTVSDDNDVSVELVELDIEPDGFRPADELEKFAATDAREAADALTLDGGRGLIGDVEEAIETAAAKLKHGPDVVAEAKEHVKAASGD